MNAAPTLPARNSARIMLLLLAGLAAAGVLLLTHSPFPQSAVARHFASDPRFKVAGPQSTEHLFQLGVHLPVGAVFVLNESTLHVATTRQVRPGEREGPALASLRYRSATSLRLVVDSASPDAAQCTGTVLDLDYYEASASAAHRTNAMFRAVRAAVTGAGFKLEIAGDGTVRGLDSRELRARIIDAVHASGQLPMHLEHALQLGGAVFPAMGAAFNTRGWRRVEGAAVRVRGPACEADGADAEKMRGRVVVADRGECAFAAKARAVAAAGGLALVVVNGERGKDVYMDGEEASEGILSVIVSAQTGRALDLALAQAAGALNVTILGGALAVQALHTGEAGTSHADVTQADGLHDLIGVGFVIDEAVRTRFSIFPQTLVGIGGTWTRSLLLADPSNPRARAVLDETFKLVQTLAQTGPTRGIGKAGDLLLDLDVAASERPVDGPAPGAGPAAADKQRPLRPALSRPSWNGHALTSQGSLRVHAASGLIISGELRTKGQSLRDVLVEDKTSGRTRIIQAVVQVDALTELDSQLVGRFP